jgi:hypothetical protein
MTMPDRDMAVAWVGRTLIDRDGVEIGSCTAVFADDATQRAEWVCSEHAGVAVLLPAVGAEESGDQVRVVISRADIAGAPPVSVERHISTDDEASLYKHYGIPHSTDASPTVLPTAEADLGTDTTPDSVSTDSLTDVTDSTDRSTTDFSTTTGTADLAAADRTAGQNGLYSSPQTPGEDTTPDSPRRGPKLASAGAALALAAAAVLGVRRLRNRKPKTRTERLAERGRVASAVLSARTARLAASAAPVVETAKRPGKAGAVVATVATALAAARRRRSRKTDGAELQEPAGYR